MYNLNIYIEQYIGDKKVSIRHSISEVALVCAINDERLITEATLIAYKQFKQEKEMELDNLRYAPRETCMPLASGGILRDPSLAPDFYRGANA